MIEDAMLKLKRLVNTDQRGFTLIEMTVAIALIGLIAGGIAMTVSQVLTVNSRTSGKMVALRQVQQAGDRVSKDVLQAGVVTPKNDSPSGFPLKLTISHFDDEGGGFGEYTVIFRLDGDRLQREYYADYVDDTSQPDYINTVARHIDTGDTTFVQAGDAWVFRVTAGFRGQTETREYEIKPRPGS